MKNKTAFYRGSIFYGKKKASAHISSIKRWMSRYESEGESGFLVEGLRNYSAEVMRMAVEEYLAGKRGSNLRKRPV